MKFIEIVFLPVVVVLFVSCSTGTWIENSDTNKRPPIAENKADSQANGGAGSNSQCDALLWKHVYDPTRLQVLDPCKIVTGTIDELDQNEDGDTHMLLKLDPGNDDLLLKKNKTKKNGDLVIEVVCANAITDKKAVGACKDYSNNIAIPNVGDHVRVTGSYVNDSHNDWAEIHPVSSIVKQ